MTPRRQSAAARKELATDSQPTDLTAPPQGIDYAAEAGSGLEHTDSEDFAVPVLKILQELSPEVDEDDPEYVPGARVGNFLHSITKELWEGDKGCTFIQCTYRRTYVKWAPRGSGRGFLGEFTADEILAQREAGQLMRVDNRLYEPMENGKVDVQKSPFISETHNHFGLVLSANGSPQKVLLRLRSTQIRKSRTLMAFFSNQIIHNDPQCRPYPTHALQLHLTTVLERNDEGKWRGLKYAAAGWTPPDLYRQAGEFKKALDAMKLVNVVGGEEAEREEDSDAF